LVSIYLKVLDYKPLDLILRNFIFISLFSFLLSCGSEEPPKDFCDFVTCLNGGECNGFSCDCPEGFEGIDCAIQIEPSFLEITEIILNEFPDKTDEGLAWDADSTEYFPAFEDNPFPDVYFVLSNLNGIIYQRTASILNVEPGMEPSLRMVEGPLRIEELYLEHKISLLDFDAAGNMDLMDQVTFFPYETDNSFPESIEVSNGITKFTLFLNYNY